MKEIYHLLIAITIVISWTITIGEAQKLYRDYKNSEIIINNYLENKEQKSQEGNKGNPDEATASTEDAPDVGDNTKVLSPAQEIKKVAEKEGFAEKEKLVKLAWCESRLKPICGELNHPDCINPKNESYDRGYYQISEKWHPEVSDKEAFNIRLATAEAIRIIRDRGWQEWSASQHCWGNKELVYNQ